MYRPTAYNLYNIRLRYTSCPSSSKQTTSIQATVFTFLSLLQSTLYTHSSCFTFLLQQNATHVTLLRNYVLYLFMKPEVMFYPVNDFTGLTLTMPGQKQMLFARTSSINICNTFHIIIQKRRVHETMRTNCVLARKKQPTKDLQTLT